MATRTLRNKVEAAKGKRDLLTVQLKAKNSEVADLKLYYEDLVKARWVLSEVAKNTQEIFKKRVESLVTMAIRSVFDRPFKFVLNFEQKRNKLEIQPVVIEGEEEYVPKDDMGGSVLDIIGFALRVVLWSLEKPKSRNIMVLDEPGKWTGKLITRFGKMIKEVSQGLGFQVIMVTHDDSLIEIADRAWHISYDGMKSVVKQIGKPDPNKVRKLKRI